MSDITPPIKLSEQQLQLLLNEAERLQAMYMDSRNGVQNVFNFYMTFITAVIGGLVFVVQLSDNSLQVTITLIGLLFFAVLVGSAYIGSLSARYANAARFAHGLDELRRYLLQHTPLPPVYHSFMNTVEPESTDTAWYLWLVPTGTYQFFMAFVNSVSLSLMMWLILGLGDVSITVIGLTCVLTFLIMLTIFNIYSRIVLTRFNRDVGVHIDLGNRFEYWAARQ